MAPDHDLGGMQPGEGINTTDGSERYEIVRYVPRFKQQLLQIQQYMWGSGQERNSAYFAWKYESNPYSDVSFIQLALCDGQVVGMRAMYVTEWEVGQPLQKFKCLSDADAVIHPDHRRRGLLERMTKASLDEAAHHGFEYSITLSASPASAANNLKLGWRSAGSLETASWRADQRGQSPVRGLAARVPFLRLAYRLVRQQLSREATLAAGQRLPFDDLQTGDAQSRRHARGHIIVDTSPRPDAMAGLIHRMGSDGRIRHTRGEDFFAWRFQNPLNLYRFLFCEDGGLEGYLVLQAPTGASNSAVIHIVDWEATNTQVRADLLRAAMQLSRPLQLVVWSATLPEEAKTLLRDHHFRLAEVSSTRNDAVWQPHVLVRPVCRDLEQSDWRLAGQNLLDLANWDLRAIYSDNF